MADTSLAAVLDDNIVYVEYYFDPSMVDNTVADVTFSLIHQYAQSNGTAQELVLQEFVVPGNLLRNSGVANTSLPIEQRASVRLINPRYRTNLVIQTQEIRSGLPVTTRVPVLVEPRDVIPGLPSNPEKDPQFQENQPALKPYRNVVSEDLNLDPVYYTLQGNGVQVIQSSSRIFLNSDGTFEEVPIGTETTPIYVENAITNFLPNMLLYKTSVLPLGTPDGYEIASPGFVAGSNVYAGTVTGQNIWQIRANLTSFLSAFNVLTLRTTSPVSIPQGLDTLTSSLYYQVTSDSGVTPFKNLVFRHIYVDAEGHQIGTPATAATPVAAQGKTWNLLSSTFTNIPASAVAVLWAVETDAVESTDKFGLLVTLPQLEVSALATTRAFEPRIQDRYQTNPLNLTLPCSIQVQTVHSSLSGLRGLFDTTVTGQNGYQFLVTGNQLQFRVMDNAGSRIVSAFSLPFTATDGSVVTYGVYVDGAQASFFLNGELINDTTAVFTQTSTQRALVGSLETSNTAVNGPLLDVAVYRDPPGV
jgi:hypothetical protein